MEILILNDPVLFLARIIYVCLTEERVMNSIHEWYPAPLSYFLQWILMKTDKEWSLVWELKEKNVNRRNIMQYFMSITCVKYLPIELGGVFDLSSRN